MAYKRKTADEYQLQGNYGGAAGWELLTTESSRKEIKQRLREYEINKGARYRIVKKRVKL